MFGDEIALIVFHDEFSLVEMVVGTQIEGVGVDLDEAEWAGLAFSEQLEVLVKIPVLLHEAVGHQLLHIALLRQPRNLPVIADVFGEAHKGHPVIVGGGGGISTVHAVAAGVLGGTVENRIRKGLK